MPSEPNDARAAVVLVPIRPGYEATDREHALLSMLRLMMVLGKLSDEAPPQEGHQGAAEEAR